MRFHCDKGDTVKEWINELYFQRVKKKNLAHRPCDILFLSLKYQTKKSSEQFLILTESQRLVKLKPYLQPVLLATLVKRGANDKLPPCPGGILWVHILVWLWPLRGTYSITVFPRLVWAAATFPPIPHLQQPPSPPMHFSYNGLLN